MEDNRCVRAVSGKQIAPERTSVMTPCAITVSGRTVTLRDILVGMFRFGSIHWYRVQTDFAWLDLVLPHARVE